MAKEFEWAGKLNSMARQAMAQCAIFAIQRFFSNCFRQEAREEGISTIQKAHSLLPEYKTSAWKLSSDKRCLTFTDGFAAGTFRLVGSRDLHFGST
jgi:putative transposase